MADWLKVLNWQPENADEKELTVWLRSINGPGDDCAVFTLRDRDRLRFLVDAWLKAKRNARTLLDGPSGLRLSAKDSGQLRKQLESVHAYWGFSADGGLIPVWFDDTHYQGFDVAVALFIRIAADPDRWRLSGPCNDKPACGKYFLRQRKTTAERKYCPHCRRYESVPRMKAIREKQRHALLTNIRKAIREWGRHPKGDWKRSVETRLDKAITRRGLTRWVNSGKLKAPVVKSKI